MYALTIQPRSPARGRLTRRTVRDAIPMRSSILSIKFTHNSHRHAGPSFMLLQSHRRHLSNVYPSLGFHTLCQEKNNTTVISLRVNRSVAKITPEKFRTFCR